MAISERILNHEAPGKSSDTQWFMVRQPGIVRFLSDRLEGDALSLALFGSYRISLAFQGHTGAPCARIGSPGLERAEEEVVRRATGASQEGLPEREPALVAYIARLVDAPAVPLSRDERRDVGMALLTVAHAMERGLESGSSG